MNLRLLHHGRQTNGPMISGTSLCENAETKWAFKHALRSLAKHACFTLCLKVNQVCSDILGYSITTLLREIASPQKNKHPPYIFFPFSC